ncbi:multidrug effflux MFS transporter [Extensimonas vulgaris]|uniref:Bcr/CflA family efflux transporter n=1 Tax=Extensimonas vulgaris TaxID=1031594 RepID=A0A369ALL3_9BURK|nr:multidrug effflux MFS transporter [Extensimonas vulgaris]RCX09057.1 DHA1 family bicyclomycin/chloramphenicol resistance-like MFS transporter [Extensimonas vulgaris]TWI37292.1 DHA1 family bicyclomycin/chloramphenicol resistance-like MFS transporter [Extensimonas vulgaris]TXD14227.1 multidrug effflux MFS transporter [Extensimonas vulgaris]
MPASPSTALHPGLAIVLLALLLSIQPVTTDLYLPALPALTRDLAAPVAAAQLSLSGLLLAFGGTQLLWGPLSDRYGRRPILLAGLAAYCAASVACVAAPSMAWLIAWRVVQGAAMGAVVMTGRAIVRDLYLPLAGARAMSKALTGLGVVACLSPLLGALLTEWLGWRAALAALGVYALMTLGLIARYLPETLLQRNPRALQPAVLVRTWAQVLRHPTFWAFSLLTTASYGGLFTFLAASSFVFIDVLGLTRTQYGAALLSNAFAYLLGTLLCRRLLLRVGLRRTVAIGGLLSLCGGGLVAIVALLGWHQAWALLAPFYLFMLGHGIHQPCGQTGAVGPFPQAAGVASACNGCITMLVAFGIGRWVGAHLDGSVWPLVQGIGVSAVALAVIAWTLVPRFGEPQAA